MTNQKWIISVFGLLLLVLFGSGCSQLNIPYQGGEKLAVLQAQLGSHAAKGEDGRRAGPPVIIGHRGSALPSSGKRVGNKLSYSGPIGNTSIAIEEAIRANVDWIEVDLRRSKKGEFKKGELVLFHDEEVDSKTTGSGAVSGLTVEELQGFDVLVDPPEKILTLREFEKKFLHLLEGRGIGLILDVKETGLVDDVLSWLEVSRSKGFDLEDVIIFGEYEILKEYPSSGYRYRLGYTFTWSGNGNRRRYFVRQPEIIERLESVDAAILVVPVVFANRRLIERASNEGVEVWSYGSDEKRDWDEVVGLGVRGLIVDYPKHAVAHFSPRTTDSESVAEEE